MTMDLFISWSGDRSRLIAQELRTWLPHVIQAVRPFCSADDIEKGRRWSPEVAAALDRANFGIVVVLAENRNAPWLLFEAGALSKRVPESKLIPLLIDLKITNLDGPLIQFQCASFSEEEVLKLMSSINESTPERLSDTQLQMAFSKFWPDLRDKVSRLSKSSPVTQPERPERDLFEETLRVVRRLELRADDPRLIDRAEHGVTFDPNSERFLIDQVGQPRYDISLERVSSTGQFLDWVLQLHGKPSIRDSQVRAFLAAVADVCRRYKGLSAQEVFCPSGATKEVDWGVRFDQTTESEPTET